MHAPLWLSGLQVLVMHGRARVSRPSARVVRVSIWASCQGPSG